MINLYAEAKMTDFLKKFLDSAMNGEYVYSFLDDIEVIPVLNSFKFGQQRLTRGEVQFHHHQLVTLARYYYYHYSDEDKRGKRDEVRRFMLEWVDTFIRAVNYFSDTKVNSWCIDRFMNGSYRIPHFDNTFPFDSIITEAIMKGELQTKLDYPDPKGLVVLNSEGKEKSYDGNDKYKFWCRQYAELCATAANLTKTVEEKYKSAKEKKEEAEENLQKPESTRDTAKKDFKKALKEFNNLLKEYLKAKKEMEDILNSVNSLRDAVFILGISYAQQNAESISLNKSKKKEKYRESRECFEFRTDLIRRSFTCFSTAENLNIFKSSEGFGKYIRKYELVKGNGYEYIFANPEDECENLPEVTLPDLEYIDNGLRIGDDDGYFYGLKMSHLTGLINYNDCNFKKIKEDYIINRNLDGTYNIISKNFEEDVREILKYYYLSYMFRIEFAWRTVFGDKKWKFTESLRRGEKLDIKELRQFSEGLYARVSAVSNNDKNDTDKPTKTQSVAKEICGLIKEMDSVEQSKMNKQAMKSKEQAKKLEEQAMKLKEQTKKSEEQAMKLKEQAKKSEEQAMKLKKRMIALVKSIWKTAAPNHQALLKDYEYNEDREKRLKLFIDSLQEKFVHALLLSEKQEEAAADLFARLAVMANLINSDCDDGADRSSVKWNPNIHLCYEKDDTFRNELLSEYNTIKAKFNYNKEEDYYVK